MKGTLSLMYNDEDKYIFIEASSITCKRTLYSYLKLV